MPYRRLCGWSESCMFSVLIRLVCVFPGSWPTRTFSLFFSSPRLLEAAAQQHHNQIHQLHGTAFFTTIFRLPNSNPPPPPPMCHAFCPPQATPSESQSHVTLSLVIEARSTTCKHHNRFTAVMRLRAPNAPTWARRRRRRRSRLPACVRQQGLRPHPDAEAPRLYPLLRCFMELWACPWACSQNFTTRTSA
jgi:hypothetical protein